MITYLLLPELNFPGNFFVVSKTILSPQNKIGDIFFVSNGKDLLAWMKLIREDKAVNSATLQVIDWDFDGEQR